MTNQPIPPRYRQALDTFDAVAAEVSEHAWAAPSPCAGWQAVDVLGHVTYGQQTLADLARGRPWPDPSTRPDPPGTAVQPDALGCWRTTRDRMLTTFARTDLDQTVLTPFGPGSLGRFLDSTVVVELTAHTWDLSQAAGVPLALEADIVAFCEELMRPHDAIIRGPYRYAQAVPVADDADPTVRLMAFLGRRPVTQPAPSG